MQSILELMCQGTSPECFGSSKISRISLVDLAGLDRSKPDDSGRQFAQEAKSIKKSLSKLGYDSITCFCKSLNCRNNKETIFVGKIRCISAFMPYYAEMYSFITWEEFSCHA